MKKSQMFLLALGLLVLLCSRDGTKLEKGTPEYDFAKKISATLPYFDPDQNKAVATTKNFTVTSGEILKSIYSNMGKGVTRFYSLDSTNLKEVLKNSIKEYVDKKLLLEAAKKENIVLSSARFDSIMQMQYRRHGSREKFIELLNQNGVSIDFVEQQIKESVIIEEFLEKVLSEKAAVTEEDIQKEYNRDKTASVRHILLLTQGKNDSEKAVIYQKMEGILQRARSGEDFATLAKNYSEDPGSKDRGGLYENFNRRDMVAPFAEAAFTVPVGEISDIVETNYGYHIIKVEERRKETRPIEEVKAQIERQLVQEKRREVYFQFMDELRQKAQFQLSDF